MISTLFAKSPKIKKANGTTITDGPTIDGKHPRDNRNHKICTQMVKEMASTRRTLDFILGADNFAKTICQKYVIFVYSEIVFFQYLWTNSKVWKSPLSRNFYSKESYSNTFMGYVGVDLTLNYGTSCRSYFILMAPYRLI